MFSFIIPTLNEEKALEATIRGLREIKDVECEIIVADSDSSDATREIAARLADRTVAYQGPPQNAARGRNLGAASARGDILAFVDADVRVPRINESFVRVARVFAEDPAVIGMVPRVNVTPRLRRPSDAASYFLVNAHFYIRNNWLGWGIGNGDLQIVRTSAFRTLGGYNELLHNSEDNEFFARLAKLGKTPFAPWLAAYHDPRRERQLGWTRLWYRWLLNGIGMMFVGRPLANEWEMIR